MATTIEIVCAWITQISSSSSARLISREHLLSTSAGHADYSANYADHIVDIGRVLYPSRNLQCFFFVVMSSHVTTDSLF